MAIIKINNFEFDVPAYRRGTIKKLKDQKRMLKSEIDEARNRIGILQIEINLLEALIAEALATGVQE
jgi:uncharacterized small protein (DUF1192 family)